MHRKLDEKSAQPHPLQKDGWSCGIYVMKVRIYSSYTICSQLYTYVSTHTYTHAHTHTHTHIHIHTYTETHISINVKIHNNAYAYSLEN